MALLSFFVLGLLFAGWIEAGKGQMLAGGAIVLGYGVLFAGIAFVGSFFFTFYAKHRIIVIGNIILGLFLLASFGYFRYRFKQKQQERATQEQVRPKKPTAPANDGKVLAFNSTIQPKLTHTEKSMGLGFFTPNFYDNPVLYFYGNPNLEKSVSDHTAMDSIVFKRLEQGGFEIAQAPPWLVPEHMKLDYDMLYFEVRSLGREFAEVTVNKQTQRTTYVNKHDGKIIYWPEFLINVHSVEFQSGSSQKVKARPFEASSDVPISFSFMHPVVVQNDWMQVELWNDNFDKVGKGWIRWRKDNQLLVVYSLLS